MRNMIGSIARHGDFFDRRPEIVDLLGILQADHALLLAPRRVGKTSLMVHLQDRPPAAWRVVYVDVESARTEAELMARLLHSLAQTRLARLFESSGAERIGALLARVRSVKTGPVEVQLAEAIDRDWAAVGEQIVDTLSGTDTPTLLLIDEFPIFVSRLLDDPDRCRAFLYWFRSLRQRCEVVRFLLAGSIGLDAVVSRAGLTATINDLVPYRLGPLDPTRARELLLALAHAQPIELSEAAIDHMLRCVEWHIPYHLQLLFAEVVREVRRADVPASPSLVDACYARLLDPDKRMHFAHWEERLRHEPPERAALIERILEAAARDPRGIAQDHLTQICFQAGDSANVRTLVHSLEHDGYLTRDGPRLRFASSLLRAWWLRWKVT